MLKVSLKRRAVNDNIIKKYQHKFTKKAPKYIIHETLKGVRIGAALRGGGELVQRIKTSILIKIFRTLRTKLEKFNLKAYS